MISAGNSGISPRDHETYLDQTKKIKKISAYNIHRCLTVTHWTALVLGLDGPGAGQHGTDDRIADHRSLLQGGTAMTES